MFRIASRYELENALVELCRSDKRTERHFGEELRRDLYNNERRADLSTAKGRILRSCVFEVFDLLRNVCQDESMLIHMCFVNRHGIEQCEEGKLVPTSVRIWDGLDEFVPQARYKNDWSPINVGELKAALSAPNDRPSSDLVRSFRCYWESYFQATGSFVAELPSEVQSDSMAFVVSDSLKEERITLDLNWESQENLRAAVLAFSKFIRKKFLFRYPDENATRSLYLISVGTNVLPWGDPRRKNQTQVAGEASVVDVQAVWIVISLPRTSVDGDILLRLSLAVSKIDAAMSQSLVMDLSQELSEKLEIEKRLKDRLEVDSRELGRIKADIRLASAQYKSFTPVISRVFSTVESPVAALTILANDLASTIFFQGKIKYKAAHDENEELDSIHTIDDDEEKQKHFIGQPSYDKDLCHRLVERLGLAGDRFAAFQPNSLERVLYLKKYVYRAFSDDHIEKGRIIKFGSLRAALYWRCLTVDSPARNGGTIDEAALAEFDGVLVEDFGSFVSGISGLIEAWLEPGEEKGRWVRACVEHSPQLERFTFSGGGSVRDVDYISMAGVAASVQAAVKRRVFDGGGNLKNSLLLLASGTTHAPPRIEFNLILQDNIAVGCRIDCRWPYYDTNSMAYTVSLVYEKGKGTGDTKTVELIRHHR